MLMRCCDSAGDKKAFLLFPDERPLKLAVLKCPFSLCLSALKGHISHSQPVQLSNFKDISVQLRSMCWVCNTFVFLLQMVWGWGEG